MSTWQMALEPAERGPLRSILLCAPEVPDPQKRGTSTGRVNSGGDITEPL